MYLWERFKAWRRDEVPIKEAKSGRCWKKKADLAAPIDGATKIKAEPTVSLVGVTVIRADGSVEEIK